jgi:hypothetical protein
MLKFDDQFPIHRKVHGLTDAAFRLHVEAIFWCARNLTDGFIAQDDLGSVSRFRRPEGYVAELVRRGAWDIADGGWMIHGYLEWQQPRSKVLQVREERRKAGAAGGRKSGENRRAGSKREPTAKQVATSRLEPPSPLAPLRGAREGRAASALAEVEAPVELEPHPFVADRGNAAWCRRCNLPRINRVHPAA